MSTETIRLITNIRDGEKGGVGVGGCTEVEGEVDYIPVSTLSLPE